MAHPYGDTGTIERLLRTGKSKVLFGNDADNDHMSPGDRALYIEDADDWIDNQLKKWYSVELTATGAEAQIIKQASSYWAAYCIWRDIHGGNRTNEEFPVNVLEWKSWAEKLINDVKEQAMAGNYLEGETLATGDIATFTQAKSSHFNTRYNEDITLTLLDWAYLEQSPVLTYSEEVYTRTTSALTSDGFIHNTALTRDTDYEMDYDNGKIRRISSGSITSGDVVRLFKYKYIKIFPSKQNELTPDLAGDYTDEYGSDRTYK